MLSIDEVSYEDPQHNKWEGRKRRPQAFCESNHVGCGMTKCVSHKDKRGETVYKYIPVKRRKDVPIETQMCPNCGHALIWRMVGVYSRKSS